MSRNIHNDAAVVHKVYKLDETTVAMVQEEVRSVYRSGVHRGRTQGVLMVLPWFIALAWLTW